MQQESDVNQSAIIPAGLLSMRMHKGSLTGLISFIQNMIKYRSQLDYNTIGYLISEPVYIKDQHYIIDRHKRKLLDYDAHYPLTDTRLLKYIGDVDNYLLLSRPTVEIEDPENGIHKYTYHHENAIDKTTIYIPRAVFVVTTNNQCIKLDLHPHSLMWGADVNRHNAGDSPRPVRLGTILFELDYNYDREKKLLHTGVYDDINIPDTLVPFFSENKPHHVEYHMNIDHHPHLAYLQSMVPTFNRDLGIKTSDEIAEGITYIPPTM